MLISDYFPRLYKFERFNTLFNPLRATVTNGKSMSKLVAKMHSRRVQMRSFHRGGKEERVAPVWKKATWLPLKLILTTQLI